MLNTIKAKFIVTLVSLQVIFLLLVAYTNQTTLNNTVKLLTDEKINVSTQLFIKSIQNSIITYDLATIDDAVSTFINIQSVLAVKVIDKNNIELSSKTSSDTIDKSKFDKMLKDDSYLENLHGYYLHVKEIVIDNNEIAKAYILFDDASYNEIVKQNIIYTFIIVLIAVIIGGLTAFIFGGKIGNSIKKLTKVAKSVAKDENTSIEYDENKKDEISILFNSMYIMQKNIQERTSNLNETLSNLGEFINALNQSAIVSKTDIDGKITYINKKFEDVTGYTKFEVIGKDHSFLRHEDVTDDFYTELWDTLLSNKIYRGTIKNRRKNGDIFYLDATIVPLHDANGKVNEFLAIRYDITDIILARDKAKETEKMRSEFLSNMSHEIRTPLNAILGFIDILHGRIKDKESLKYLDTIQNSSKTLLHIINDILDISKIESGKFDIDLHKFKPHEDIKNSYNLFELQAKEKNINYSLDISKSVPKYMLGDFLRINQILFNLLSNSFKFTKDHKSINLKVDYNKENSLLCFSVEDEGIGIDENKKDKIFEPFIQADTSTTRKYGGTGLGLTISLALIEIMNGEIKIESELGVGTSIKFSIPVEVIAEEESDDDDNIVTDEETSKDLETKVHGTILVAEDNKTNQLLMSILLDEYDVEYTIANDGLEAVKEFKNKDYALVLMDENMPNLNGIGALLQIREHEKEKKLNKTPIVAVTANVLTEDKERFFSSGMDDFIAKPIDSNELDRVIKKFLS